MQLLRVRTSRTDAVSGLLPCCIAWTWFRSASTRWGQQQPRLESLGPGSAIGYASAARPRSEPADEAMRLGAAAVSDAWRVAGLTGADLRKDGQL